MSWDELQEYKQMNPHLKQVLTAPNVISGTISASNVDNHGFKEVLQKVGEAHPNSAVAKEHTRRSGKEVKTRQVVEKHAKLQARKKKNV